MPANPQEKLVGELSQSTLGRRYVFEPDEYRKGKGARREPADVAWSCRDVVTLMYLKSGQKGWKRDTEGNLRQAAGWLAEWRRGRPLDGRVEEGHLSVSYRPSLAILILSVSADPALTEIVRHDDVARSLGVDACATVSETFLQCMASNCLGVADLALMLREWPKARGDSPAITDLEFFNSYCLSCMERAAEKAAWRPTDLLTADLEHIASMIRNLRSVKDTPGADGAGGVIEPNEFFSDFTLAEQWQLLYVFGRAIELVRDGMPHMQLETQIDTYRVVVQVTGVIGKWVAEAQARMIPSDHDIVFSYPIGIPLMPIGVRPTLTVRSPTVAWRVLRRLSPCSGQAQRPEGPASP